MAEPQFDPNQPFEVVEPTFDPSQPFEVIEGGGPLPVPEAKPEFQGLDTLRDAKQGLFPGSRATPEGAQITTEVSPIVLKAAAAGVLFDKPAPAGSFLSGLAIDDKNRLDAYRVALAEKSGAPVKVRIGPKTGEIEYWDSEAKRFALAVPPSATAQTFQQFAGPAMALSPEVFAGLGAALFTKSPALVNVVSAGGAFIGEASRLALGQKMGINQNATTGDIAKAAATAAGISFIGGEATRHLVRVTQFVRNVIKGDAAFTPKTIKDLNLDADEAQKISDDINDVIGAERMKFDLAQATNDTELMDAREVFRKSPGFKREFGNFEDEQSEALNDFYSTINKPYNTRLDPSESLDSVQGVAESQAQRRIDKENLFVVMKEADLRSASDNIKTRPHGDLGAMLRDVGDAEQQAFTKWAKEAAASLNKAAGDKEFIENDLTHQVVNRIDERVRRALFPKTESGQRSLLGGMIEDVDGEEAIRKVFDPDAKFTFSEAWEAISALKRMERAAKQGLSTDPPDIGAVKSLYRALEHDLRKSAQNSSLRGEYDAFITKYASEKNRLDDGFVAKLMEKSGSNGRHKISDFNAFSKMFTAKDDQNAKDVFELIKNRPQEMQAIREGVGDFYKKLVMPDGRVNLERHKEFMNLYGRSAAVFFNKNEMKLFAKPGQVEKALRAREQARSVALDRINNSFEMRIAKLDNPGQLMNLVMDKNDPGKARELMSILEKTPDIQRAFRNRFIAEITEKTKTQRSAGGRNFSASGLDRFLNGRGGEAGFRRVVEEVVGDKYLKNLDTLNDALKITSREAKFPNRSNTAFWLDTVKNLSRAYVGLFTRPGRFITAVDRVRGRASEKVIARAILNPQSLDELMSLRGVDMRSQKAAAILGAFGASSLYQDFGPEGDESVVKLPPLRPL